MNTQPSWLPKSISQLVGTLMFIMAIACTEVPTFAADSQFGPNNPFYSESKLPFQAPPFDKIKDTDYQPAIEAGMEQQREEIKTIAENSAPPTFENTIVAMEKTGRLFD